MSEKDFKFYKDFYETNRVKMLQYENLRKHFNKLVRNVLGKDYYNLGMNVYEVDRICCEDIENKTKGFWKRLLG